MPKPPRPWTVERHGPVEQLEENLWTVTGDVPGVPGLKRRMAIARRSDGGLVFFNAVPVSDEALREIRALGRPAFLVVPQHLHMIDAHAFREKLGVKVYAPRLGRTLVEARVRVDGTFEEMPPDPAVRVESVPGFGTGEGVAWVRSGERTSLVVADVVLNVPDGPGFRGWLFRMLGMTGPGPRLPLLVKLRVVRDRGAVRRWMEAAAAAPGLARIVVSHGRNVDRDAAGALRAVAGTV
ncbi:MAG TPA: hypothetical protein VFM53_08255 [Anaeromyxobacteraceae bacterium]|nr:hypothetical protein [Anaeromyxobacteraceae bacterium]